jgi:hypothetical protein
MMPESFTGAVFKAKMAASPLQSLCLAFLVRNKGTSGQSRHAIRHSSHHRGLRRIACGRWRNFDQNTDFPIAPDLAHETLGA